MNAPIHTFRPPPFAPAAKAASITALLSVLVIPAGTEITNSGLNIFNPVLALFIK